MKRRILYLTSVIAALLVLTSCGGAGPTTPNQLDLEVVKGTAGPDSLRYTIHARGFGVEQNQGEHVTFIFDCERFPDGRSVLTISTEDGEVIATATRTKEGQVTLVTASGLEETSASSTLEVTEDEQGFLSLVQWVLIDATIFSHYPVPADAPEQLEQNLETWKNGLTLVDSVEPAPAVTQQAISPQFDHCPRDGLYRVRAFSNNVQGVHTLATSFVVRLLMCIPF